ncbi:hypothetical protein QYE76_007606 [Lolium multiflorum]|uniref:Uncharacterized protein n=1 Tax=Lolium multiflorum TaxID=4521 RepID=A0AAD8QEA9_LOLMU|nr:hypothetical protein QYE76_007606 [Lolium multiflorum]
MAGEDQPLTDYEKERLSRIRENEARLQALGIRRLAASPLLNQPSSAAAAAAAKRKQKKRSDDVDEEYLPSDESGGEEEENGESSSASDEFDGKETKPSSRSRQKGKKKKLLNSGSSSKSTFREEGVPVTDFMDEDAALQQAIALSLAEPSQNSVTAIGAETSSAGAKGRKGTPCENKNNTPIQDSAKNRKAKKQVRSRIQLSEDDVVAFFFSFDGILSDLEVPLWNFKSDYFFFEEITHKRVSIGNPVNLSNLGFVDLMNFQLTLISCP